MTLSILLSKRQVRVELTLLNHAGDQVGSITIAQNTVVIHGQNQNIRLFAWFN